MNAKDSMVREGGKIGRFTALLSGCGRVVVCTHSHPDGDAIGSCLAASRFIRTFFPGTQVYVVMDSSWPHTLDFLPEPGDSILRAWEVPDAAGRAVAEADLIICTDISGLDRCGSLEDALRGSCAPKVQIDHHLNPHLEEFVLSFSDTEVSSACELLFRILKGTSFAGGECSRLPQGVLKALLAGITTDTNNFANSVFPGTLSSVSEILATGTDRDAIVQEVFNSHSIGRIRITGHLLSDSLETDPCGAAWMVLDNATMERFGVDETELEGLVNIPLTAAAVRLSIFAREDDGFWRVSVRSKKGTSAQQLCERYFHGGGHELASGGKIFLPEDVAGPELIAGYLGKIAKEFLAR